MLLSDIEVTGMGHPRILSYASGISKMTFITEGVHFCDEMGIPTVKRLKPDAVPTVFARSVDCVQTSSSQCSTPTTQPLSERKHQRSVRQFSIKLQACMGNNS